MFELLKKLVESEILTDETKTQLEEAFASQMADLVKETKETTEEAVRVELAAQWLTTRDSLIEAIDQKVTAELKSELAELHETIDAHKDLEVEMATKLTEAKAEMAVQVKADLASLIEQLDPFLETRIKAEYAELKDNIAEAKKVDFGRRVVEAFATEFQEHFVDQNEVKDKLAEAEAQLQAVTAKLTEAAAQRAKLERTLKLEGLLSDLQGNPRQLMETILSNYATDELDKAFTKFIGRVLKESNAPAKEAPVLAEGVTPTPATGVVKTGDAEALVESQKTPAAETVMSAEEKRQLQRMAGIIN